MSAILLDTDVFSFFVRRGDTRATLYERLLQGKAIALSFVTIGELYCWAAKRRWGTENLANLEKRIYSATVLPFDIELCRVYGRLKANLPPGRVIPDNDFWIATCAVRYSVPLVTHNRRDYEGIAGLEVISEASK